MPLVGRRTERAALDGLLAAVRSGHSATLVITGEAGIGKTALVDHAVSSATDIHVTSVVGVESEVELAFAGVHQLLAPMLERLPALPLRQREALRAAFGLVDDGTPDRFLVGAGILTLLTAAAKDGPILCVVDDAHWLDRASADALAFACRRFAADPIGVIFAARDLEGRIEPLVGLPELRVRGLAEDDARELLTSRAPGPIADKVRDEILFAAGGNPLAIEELPAALTATELDGTDFLLGPIPLKGRLEEHFRRQIDSLPAETRSLLLLAAINDPRCDPELFWTAADRAGKVAEHLAPAERIRLVRSGSRVVFRHPLIRSAVYTGATTVERRRAHQILGEAADPERDPDLRAWHLGAASVGADDARAAELESAAARSIRRGGYTGAAAFLKRAAQLTSEPPARAERYLAAAELELAGGAPEAAEQLVSSAKKESSDGRRRARAERLLGMVAFDLGRMDAPVTLVRAATAYEPLDARLARDTHLEAMGAAYYFGTFAGRTSIVDAARAALAAPKASGDPTPTDLLLEGLASESLGAFRRGGEVLREAMLALRGSEDVRLLGWACVAAVRLWDNDMLRQFATRMASIARESGALTVLPLSLVNLAFAEVIQGRFEASTALMNEVKQIAAATGSARAYVKHAPAELLVEAWRGGASRFQLLSEAAIADARTRGEGALVSHADHARAVLELGLGNYAQALVAAQSACNDQSTFSIHALPELVDAAVRCGDLATATSACDRLSETVAPSRKPLGLGLEARSRALLTEGGAAEELHREAIRHLELADATPQRACALLVYGEWLRRRRRRKDARAPLTTAAEMFDAIGARAFGDRARAELRATGEVARPRKQKVSHSLTTQETMIAQMVADGASNPDVALRLSISRKTVESHLNKIFRKLGVSSRTQLASALAQLDGPTGPEGGGDRTGDVGR